MIRIPRVAVIAAAALHATAVFSQDEAEAMNNLLSNWLQAYEQAWESRDADAAAALFTEDARYYETPYAEPFVGSAGIRDYWSGITANQRDVEFQWQLVSSETASGVARWNATFTLAPDDVAVELDGIFVLQFDDDGRCRELREWWHAR